MGVMSFAWHLPTMAIAVAVGLDLLLGDPSWLPHPVRLIGAAIELSEKRLWSGNASRDLCHGAIAAVVIVLAASTGTWFLIALAELLAPTLGAVVSVILAWSTIALRGLDGAAAAVEKALGHDDLADARAAVPALVGRDPQSLDRDGLVRAVIESVAENSSDGVLAPLLYLFIAGPAAAMAYKTINTLASMIGHTDVRYLYFGRWAARMDDLANLVPARVSAGCLAAAAAIWGQRPLDALRVCWADARRHPSPNAGFPEAAMAGALGIQLGGVAVYGGETEMRPLIGVARQRIEVSNIATARRLLWTQSIVAFVLMVVTRMLLRSLWTR